MFGTVEHCDILNMPITSFHQLPNARWCHLAKDKSSLFSYYKQSKVTLLNHSCFLAQSKCYKKIDFMNTIVSLKDLWVFYANFVQDITSPFADASRSWQFSVRPCSLQIKLPTSTTLGAVQANCGRPLSSRFSIHCCSRFCSALYSDYFC